MSEDTKRRRGYPPGILLEIIRELAMRLNKECDRRITESLSPNSHYSVTLVPLPDTMQNRVNPRNNSWEGPIGFLARKAITCCYCNLMDETLQEADFWATAALADQTYSSIADYSFPFALGEAAIAMRTRKQSDNLRFLIIVSPFDAKVRFRLIYCALDKKRAQVWAALFATIIVSALVLRYLSHWIVDKCGIVEVRYDTTTSSWVFFSMIVGQGETWRMNAETSCL